MRTRVNIHQAKTQLSKLVERASRGEEIVIAKAGKPIARLVPLDECRERRPGLVQGRLTEAFFEPLADDDVPFMMLVYPIREDERALVPPSPTSGPRRRSIVFSGPG
jgi:prevent-host-death family protein